MPMGPENASCNTGNGEAKDAAPLPSAPQPTGAKGLKRRWMEQHQRQQEELERKAKAEQQAKEVAQQQQEQQQQQQQQQQ
eukprot:CAMPEP_0202398980 /NCGR_PEP_ID=MMETSP1128-20130828/1688_1 /ASSEMBLY_ACC=CAM_ASM_000463 /TAXON_ID=3047 /ORGANISM="Dunaliella tertiolecta, Strain CCMP1320" /LENGTH=79 /DNA_ID=CAMNT_0049002211 /DNA_START=160 /DNA_END=396 /DNA_ORIENTATION=-